jgi:hypothetical protein
MARGYGRATPKDCSAPKQRADHDPDRQPVCTRQTAAFTFEATDSGIGS